KFNMSEEDAQTLVDYFAAADRLANPSFGLTHPYLTVPQRHDEFWRDKSQEYAGVLAKAKELEKRMAALAPIWEQYRQTLEQQLKETQTALAAAEKAVKDAEDADNKADKGKKPLTQKALEQARANRDSLKRFAEQLKAQLDAASTEALNKQWKNN